MVNKSIYLVVHLCILFYTFSPISISDGNLYVLKLFLPARRATPGSGPCAEAIVPMHGAMFNDNYFSRKSGEKLSEKSRYQSR